MIDLTGTHEECMREINNAPISEGFKEYVRKEHQKHCDELDTQCVSNLVDLDIEHEKNSIPIHEIVPKGMTIKKYYSKEQRLLRGESIKYVMFDKDGYQ